MDEVLKGSDWRTALRAEPRMRSYLLGSLVDDLGIAASGWAWQLIFASLFVDQRTRASVMMPSMLCFVIGAALGGPLADWGGRIAARYGIAQYRWRVLLVGRCLETLALLVLAISLIGHEATLPRILPYFLISALMKTGLRPTRIALEVDLLQQEQLRTNPRGEALLDEAGQPLRFKTHLLSYTSWLSASTALAAVVGLLIGGWVTSSVGQQVWILALVDVATNVAFVVVLYRYCKPAASPESAQRVPVKLRAIVGSIRQTFGFLFAKARRPLLVLLIGAVAIEAIQECYDGRMIIKQLLGASDNGLRYSELGWMLSALGMSLLLPALAARIPHLGRLFVVLMTIDAVVMLFAGRAAGLGVGSSVMPFAALITLDRGLTAASSTLASLAQNSSSSAAMRGRLAGLYTFVVLFADIIAQGAATGLAETIGIPAMVTGLGYTQLALMALLTLLGGRALWRFRLRTNSDAELASQPAV